MALFKDALLQPSEALGPEIRNTSFRVGSTDVEKLLGKFGRPDQWREPVVLVYEPQFRAVERLIETPQPTRKKYNSSANSEEELQVLANKLGTNTRKWENTFSNDTSSSFPSDHVGTSPSSRYAEANSRVRVGQKARIERRAVASMVMDMEPIVDRMLDHNALVLERFRGSYLDNRQELPEGLTALAVTFLQTKQGRSFLTEDADEFEFYRKYRIFPSGPEDIYFQGVLTIQETDGELQVFYTPQGKNILSPDENPQDPDIVYANADAFLRQPHPESRVATPFYKVLESGRVPSRYIG